MTRTRTRARVRRPWRRTLAVSTLLALVGGGLSLSTAQEAEAGVNLLVNPGFESLKWEGTPRCWDIYGWGDNDHSFKVTDRAHSGGRAMELTLTRRAGGDRKAMMYETPSCAPNVTPGHQYDLSVWYTSTSPDIAVTLFRHDVREGWVYWTDVMSPPMSTEYRRAEVRTPAVPPGTDQISWGVSLYGTGTLTTDDYAMRDATLPAAGEVCTAGRACTEGAWEVLPFRNPVRSMHAVVLRTGKVLLVAGSGNDPERFARGTFESAVYDPADGSFKEIRTPIDMFCAGHVQLSDGKVLIMGGNKGYPSADGRVGYQGYKDSYLFDPGTETYTRTNDMNDGHWYPSATVLGNGDVISFGGLREDSTGSVTAEKWSAARNAWLPMGEVKQTWSYWGLYPSMILMQDGRLFYSGSHVFGGGTPGTGASVYDYEANTVTDVPGLRNKDERDQSASVLLPPAQDQRVLTIGGGNNETNPDANRLTDIIDLKRPSPSYEPGPPLPQGTQSLGGAAPVPQTGAQGKMYVSAVLLPDGKVFETGGALHNRADPVYEASMFDPATDTWQPGMATDPADRGYHSASFLLPDGRVMSVGDNPGDGSYTDKVSVYTPPYLFKGPRPQITSVIDNRWRYGDTQRITVDRPIARAELIRPSAVTHSSDPNQRFVDLPMSVLDDRTIDLNVTSNPDLAPPGWYMLFGVDAAGVPTVAEWVHLGGPAASDAPSPHVHDFAGELERQPRKAEHRRASAPVSPRIAGCDRHYGTADVCVPTAFPRPVRATTKARCDWLASHGYARLKVNGEDDPLRLDPDRDGRACGRGDLRGGSR
ncbi:galactose oxidase early set domain-containing protein [Streptomyces sp. SP18CS02]|uniref:galactose oxidase early set domain-containing protein n=1 Tax=Streptomyces sp. SP18CS02 TaxID=3002531 RepID=UPI002E797A98|nr:galactose oxidase early set domain-containing protein [Streptomyces sp. SP18CS02]MEE1756263.1 galactose oxidase early set domain-containing protein [Streptomyces sp. SP18CS02]